GIKPPKGIMFVCNSCEEGLGNLKGVRRLFSDFEGRIKTFITFDSNIGRGADHCVGSHRYEVTVKTEGGHSYQKFGNDNAIEKLSGIIQKIYEIKVPEKEGAKTTYNVGKIEGGTSINTIAQSAKMLCEYRSTDFECLEIMRKNFEEVFESARNEKVEVIVEKVGDRPCENIDREKIEELKSKLAPATEKVTGEKMNYVSGSTDCNIPLSLNIAALCIGVNYHEGIHTREEWVEKKSLIPGLEIAINSGLALMEE
ncbi:MAG: peptidase dimerization domain-containing protein, partial [Clostridia bacterium]|nr:peptidase dimerization domain-containing protein [Clostridia bacterium]